MAAKRFFPVVRWVLSAQVFGAASLAALVWMLSGRVNAVWTVLGGLIAILPNVYFSYRFGVRDDSRTARQVAKDLYGGEVAKVLMTAGLFALVLQLPGLNFLPVLGGFVFALTVFWFALLMRGSHL
jgi:ATP synthase protein I